MKGYFFVFLTLRCDESAQPNKKRKLNWRKNK